MDKEKSDLVAAIERLGVHDHLCLIYETQEEEFASVIPFMRIGLEKGEKCVYIVDENTAGTVLAAMREEGIDVDSCLKSGAFAVATKRDAYLKEGYFDPDMMIAFLNEATGEAKKAGYPALRVTGEMTWALGSEAGVDRLIEYEAKLNYFIPDNDVLAICQYNKNRFKSEIIAGVIKTHPLVIYGNTVCKNYYYVPPDEFLNPAIPSREVNRLLYNIIDREQAEAALLKHKAMLEESNRQLQFEIAGHIKAREEASRVREHLEEMVKERTAMLYAANKELEERATELKNAYEKLKEVDRLKNMFISTMSHELRTPLNSIIGFSSIMLDEWIGPLNEEQKKNLVTVHRSGQHLLALINDVIDISKIEAGMVATNMDEFDLYDVISEAVSSLLPQIKDKGLEIAVETIHQPMRNDRRRLLQSLLNLMSNAVKFTERGRIFVGAGLAPALNGQPQGLPLQEIVEITVSDTGIGIKEEDMPKLFQSFIRIDSPLRSKVGGTGLGLYLTKKLVTEVLKGEITVSSRYGEGSRFVMRIPWGLQ